jgi:hypothetical protein
MFCETALPSMQSPSWVERRLLHKTGQAAQIKRFMSHTFYRGQKADNPK